LDLVTMRGRDVPKQELDNKSLLWYTYFAEYPSLCLYVFLFIYSWCFTWA
jgi:hypothetical protein